MLRALWGGPRSGQHKLSPVQVLGWQESDLIKHTGLFLDKQPQLRPLGSHGAKAQPWR